MSRRRGRCDRRVGLGLLFAAAIVAVLAPGSARAQALSGEAIDERAAVHRALEANPSLRAVVLEHRRASALVLGEESRYQLVLGVEGNLSLGDTPSLTAMTRSWARPTRSPKPRSRGWVTVRVRSSP